MSRAFVKESEAEQALPDRPVSPHENLVTESGLTQLKARVEALEAERAALKARAEDFEARARLPQVERDLRYFQRRAESAALVPPPEDDERVQFGSSVVLEDEDGERHRFRIVGEDEADPGQGLLAWTAPLARALVGHEVGDAIRWPRPGGDIEVVLVEIGSE